MTTYNLSVVIITPDAHRQAVNDYAESLGWGENNMSIELVGSDSSVWWGCHTWAAPSFLDDLGLLAGDAKSEYAAALAATKISAVDGGDPGENLARTIAQYGLSVKPDRATV